MTDGVFDLAKKGVASIMLLYKPSRDVNLKGFLLVGVVRNEELL